LAAVAHAAAYWMRRTSANKLENMHLDAMSIRFLGSGCEMLAVWSAGIAGCHAVGIEVGDTWTSILASSSFVIGLASQNVLQNFAAGLMIIYTQPFQVGDKVKVAGITGKVVSVGFFQTKLVDAENEGHIVPNKDVNGALESLMSSFDKTGHQLRKSKSKLIFSSSCNLEKIHEVLEGILPAIDKFVDKKNSDKTQNCYANGTYDVAEYYRQKYQRCLADDQKSHKASVHCEGQEPDSGFIFVVEKMTESTLVKGVSHYIFREAVKACQEPKHEITFFSSGN